MHAFTVAVGSALLGLCACGSAQASTTAAQAAPIDPQAVVDEVRRIIAQRYVLPERRPALDAVLAEGLSSGRYNLREATALAEKINEDLARVGRDQHLNISYNPQRSAMVGAARNAAAPDMSAYERDVRSRNHGVAELKVLPGNVRYMAYNGFDWIGPESATALENAMRFLSGGDAVIIDLRRNGGGHPFAVQYLVSHFMEAGRPLITFHMNGEPTPDSLSTLPDLPAGRIVGKPLYVLTSPATASAAEEFTGHVSGYRLGELVGETTSGAGFRNDLVAIQGGFVLSVSVGRAVLASTGRDWEGVGHAPTLRAPIEHALYVAQSHALRRLAEQASGQHRARLQGLADVFTARTEPRSAALPLPAYVGRYGQRAVAMDGGKLWYSRPNQAATALIPLGDHRFSIESDPGFQLVFEPQGATVASFELVPLGGLSQGRYQRTQ